MKLSPIIKAEDLQHLENDNLVIVHAGNRKDAYESYLNKHLTNALFADLNDDLAEIPANAKNGGRHPLPSLEKFSGVLQNLGINKKSHVIVYDDKNGANAAARFWWMLRSVGIEKVQVLDGGIQEAEKCGIRLISDASIAKKAEKINLTNWKFPTVDINIIDEHAKNPSFLIIDVREEDRYNGKIEPIDLVAGHIPGAENLPFKNNLEENGTFKNPEILKEEFNKFIGKTNPENIIVHCGSGVTACHTILAMHYAGFEIPKLYVGSWSEWSRNNKLIAKNI